MTSTLNHDKIIKRIDLLEAMADSIKKEAISLREDLGAVSTAPTPKRQRQNEEVARVMANYNKNFNKRLDRAASKRMDKI